MGCSPPGSSVHENSSDKKTGVGCHFLLQGIFLTQVFWLMWILHHHATREAHIYTHTYIHTYIYIIYNIYIHTHRCFNHVSLWHYDCNLPSSSVMGFSRQEYWGELPCLPLRDLPYPGIESKSPASPALEVDSFPLSYWRSPWREREREEERENDFKNWLMWSWDWQFKQDL